ncbi:unnamed protein product [Effrenium voratum]|nr:unnamed protein product [Effrenium voratum]
MALLFSLRQLPGFMKVGRLQQAVFVGPWSLSAGTLTFLLVLMFRRPCELVFLDRLCINQRDVKQKMEGVLNIGACLKRSEKLMIIWDSSYCYRLWCIFELAAFLRTHETPDMLVQPLSVAVLSLLSFMTNVVFCYTSIFLPWDSEITLFGVVLGLCAFGWLASTVLLNFTTSVEVMQKQLQNFQIADTTCSCCERNHKSADGTPLMCDREVLLRCIRVWFGSEEEFERSVQESTQAALVHHLGGLCFPYHYMVTSGLPALWVQMDFAASRWYIGDNTDALENLVIGIAAIFLTIPANLAATHLCGRCTSRCRPMVRKLLAAAVCAGLLLASQGTIQICMSMFRGSPVPGGVVHSAFWLLPAWALWRSASSKSKP